MCEEGFVSGVTVYLTDSEKTSVLDKNGDPFTINKKQPIGFKLRGVNKEWTHSDIG